jgi:hypothetical protein
MTQHNPTLPYPTLCYVTFHCITFHFITLLYITYRHVQYIYTVCHKSTLTHTNSSQKDQYEYPKFHGESSTVFLLTPEVEGKFLISRHIQISSCRIIYTYIYIYIYSQPWINKPLGCLIGRVPFKYQIMTIGGIPA